MYWGRLEITYLDLLYRISETQAAPLCPIRVVPPIIFYVFLHNFCLQTIQLARREWGWQVFTRRRDNTVLVTCSHVHIPVSAAARQSK